MTVVDVHGRVASRAVLDYLGWETGTRVQMQMLAGLIALTVDRAGPQAVATRGVLRLPVGLRRSCGLETGERVLLAADREDGVLLVYPLAVLDNVLPHDDGVNAEGRP
jgi:hypothetical protein